jgi:hypothetical protein
MRRTIGWPAVAPYVPGFLRHLPSHPRTSPPPPRLQWLPALLITVPLGAVLACVILTFKVMKALWLVFTPLLWPLYFFCTWYRITCAATQVVVTDTIVPALIPLRFTILAALLPMALKS